jgi:MoaA/NifB/PqqE/SkfB family radical SAM enzyme
MNLILTNYGHKFITEQSKSCPEQDLLTNPKLATLKQVLSEKAIEMPTSGIYEELVKTGYLETNNTLDLSEIEFKYRTNPLENVTRIVFEFTTQCNFNCAHCRNGSMEKSTETDIEKLKSVSDAFIELNINRFDFIGGEVSKYGVGWLQLAKHTNRNFDKTITVFSNGWWLEKTDFEAAGKHYVNDIQYLSDLKQNGVTHILFSIDGHEDQHDKSRKHVGLYHKIISSFDRIKLSGIEPRISALLDDNLDERTIGTFLDIANRIYNFPENMEVDAKVNSLVQDPTNQFSNFIDIGSAVNLKKKKHKISEIPPHLLRCKAFYRPWPSLKIKADGSLSVCPLLDAGNGYGNIHHGNIVELINNFRQAFVYKLHADNKIVDYLKYLDTSIFGEYFDHICSIRVILTLMATYLNEEEVINSETILKINRKIAQYSGHLENGK